MVISAHDFPLWPSIILLMVHNVINTEFGSSNHSNQTNCCISWLVNLPPPNLPPSETKGLIAGLIKGNQWLTGPDHKALFLGGGGVRLAPRDPWQRPRAFPGCQGASFGVFRGDDASDGKFLEKFGALKYYSIMIFFSFM